MSKINFKFVSLSQEISPAAIVDKRSDIVRYGEDNMFPQHLLNLSTQSALHTAILDKKIKMLTGEGLMYDGENKKQDAFLKNCNPYESLNEVFMKCATDLEIFGGFSLQVVWDKTKTKVAELYHTPLQNIRSEKANKYGQVEQYFYYDDWKKYTRYKDTAVIQSFNPNKVSNRPQLMYARKYSATNLYYPMPSYIGGLSDINTLYEISIFHNACITNNFQPGIMIIFRGPTPTEEEQAFIMKSLTEKYSGAKNAGTPSVFFLDTDQEQPQIEQTQVSDLDKQYTTLTEAVKENVTLAHSIPRIVAGLEKSGSLGGSKEIIEANQVFYNEYVVKNQEFMLSYFNKIMEINKFDELIVKNSTPSIFLYSENLLEKVLTQNEMRDIFGYEPMEDGLNDEGDVTIEEEPTPTTEKNNEMTDE